MKKEIKNQANLILNSNCYLTAIFGEDRPLIIYDTKQGFKIA